ncbi:MAG: hybrid sensor histidine kinase/response regulator [Thermoanaerobaculia bacterium]
MDSKREEFLRRLRETFRVEASEHIDAIRAGMLAIEHAGGEERAGIVERIFRDAHSLKGAARSVNLPRVEELCRELESIFAAMKRDDRALSPEACDSIHAALGVLTTWCLNPGDTSSPAVAESGRHALEALQNITKSGAALSSDPPGRTARGAPPNDSTAPKATAAVPAGPAASGEAPSSVAPDTVRVATRKINAILLETQELVAAKIVAGERAVELRGLAASLADWNRLRAAQAMRERSRGGDTAAPSERIESERLFMRAFEGSLRKLAGATQQDARDLAAATERLLADTRELLLLPCSYLLAALPAVVRDLTREEGKEAELLVRGDDLEVDRRVLDDLRVPLIHLLRNSIDHGIERPDVRVGRNKPRRGTIAITATLVEANRLELTVADDGSGIDIGKVRASAVRQGSITANEAAGLSDAEVTDLVFRSGISTSPIVTDLSGRGLGLAIVREKVERLGGTVSVTSTLGAGTLFRILAPLSIEAFRGVSVDLAGRRFVIPTASVVRVIRVKPEEIRTVENRQTLTLDERAVSVVRLRDVLGVTGPDAREREASRPAVVLRASGSEIAFLVDEVLGEHEVVVKNLGRQLARVRNVAGASISGSGAVVPILNAVDLVRSATNGSLAESSGTARNDAPEHRRRLLIAEDSITSRTLLKNILEGAGFDVVAAVDGLDALTKLKSDPFDLVVSDVDMPRLNGFELTARIRSDKKLEGLPVVLVTSLGSPEDREYGITVGANAYIVKSDFDQGNLLEIIRRLL